MLSGLLRGKVSRSYILFRYGADQNVTSLTCGNWSRLTGLVKIDKTEWSGVVKSGMIELD